MQVTATVCDECLVTMEKALLHSWVEDVNRTCVLIGRNLWHQVALSLHRDFSKGSPETSDTKTPSWVYRLGSRFGLKDTKITGEAVSGDEEAAVVFPEELKKLVRAWYYPCFQAATGGLGRYPHR